MSERKCNFCGKAEVLPFRCKYCNMYFCSAHRLPENHDCVDISSFPSKSSVIYSKSQELCEMCYIEDKTIKECNLCGRKYCIKHAKPQNHNCIALQTTNTRPYSSSYETYPYQTQEVSWQIGTWTLGSEIRDLSFGALLILFVFIASPIAFNYLLNYPLIFVIGILLPGIIVVITGFMFHELAHRFMSKKLGYVSSKFVLWKEGTLFTLFSAIIGMFGFFGIICPGFVLTSGTGITREESGKISAAGPITNLFFGIAFLLATFFFSHLKDDLFRFVVYQAFRINISLGLFNMLPFGPLDGRKVLDWNQRVFFFLFGILGILWVLSIFL